MKQLYQSNDNFLKSCLSINSSKNFYPIIGNINIVSNIIDESGNINNLNFMPFNQIMTVNNNTLLNLNNRLNNINNENFGKNNIIQEKKFEEKNNKYNSDN